MGTRMVAVGGALGAAVLLSGCASTVGVDAGQVNPATGAGSSVPARVCPPAWSHAPGQGVAVDYVDSVRLTGHDFIYESAADPAAPHPVPGAPVGRVQCRITAYQVDPAYRLQDGDATFLPVGTTLYAVVGLDPAQVVAVRAADGIRLYRVPTRNTGS
jgi:hypothetical protein